MHEILICSAVFLKYKQIQTLTLTLFELPENKQVSEGQVASHLSLIYVFISPFSFLQ